MFSFMEEEQVTKRRWIILNHSRIFLPSLKKKIENVIQLLIEGKKKTQQK